MKNFYFLNNEREPSVTIFLNSSNSMLKLRYLCRLSPKIDRQHHREVFAHLDRIYLSFDFWFYRSIFFILPPSISVFLLRKMTLILIAYLVIREPSYFPSVLVSTFQLPPFCLFLTLDYFPLQIEDCWKDPPLPLIHHDWVKKSFLFIFLSQQSLSPSFAQLFYPLL